MMEMECFSVYTQKLHPPDLRSFVHCFIYKLHLMSSWVHLNRDKLIEWEFFHPACTTQTRLLDGPSMEMKILNMKYFRHKVRLHFTERVGISCRCRCMQKLFVKILKVALLQFFQPLYLSLHTLVVMEFTSIHFCQCFENINIPNTTIITDAISMHHTVGSNNVSVSFT